MITVEHVNCRFGKHQILKEVCLTIPKGKITAIAGPSGCGKTTLLKCLNRMIEEEGGQWSGKIQIDGKEIQTIPADQLRSQVGMVFQQPVVFPYSIEKNLSYVLRYYGIKGKEERERKMEECLKKARLYEEVWEQRKRSARKLSGGQKQRLAIARSFCADPDILLLDEPCSALDMKNTMAIEETLMEWKGQYTFVLVTHDLGQAERIADQIVFMDQGEVLEVMEQEQFRQWRMENAPENASGMR